MKLILVLLCWASCAIASSIISFRLDGHSLREITVYDIVLFLFFAPLCFVIYLFFLLVYSLNSIIDLDYQPLRANKTKSK